MKIQPTVPNKPQPTFGNRIYKYTKPTLYGKRIYGDKNGVEYNVYVDGNDKNIFYKLYMVYKNDKWVKSVLKFFSDNKLYKEVKSIANV